MGTLTIILRSGTMMNMDPNVAIKLAHAAMWKGHRVKLVCYGEGATVVKDGQDPKRFPNIGEILEVMVEDGLEVAACEACCSARGIHRGEVINGARIGSLINDLSRFASESDKMVTIAR
ncbi:DsrE family protein [Methanomassiliicoccus luminyensis]|jgi:sulfur relay (sulfurtransferase) complex TusBCD TusD component (DsrE family)|uniref:DsrE family protein n=1 Tax=Methanomassiliicoccus luminyensis TaxID=1080712 RepID=UPI000474FFD7|nr:DsrE family protein [Methanomassiliicoccus luminyensis]